MKLYFLSDELLKILMKWFNISERKKNLNFNVQKEEKKNKFWYFVQIKGINEESLWMYHCRYGDNSCSINIVNFNDV